MQLPLNTNTRNSTILTQVAVPVDFQNNEIEATIQFIQHMKDTMDHLGTTALALAANQVWTPDMGMENIPQVFVMRISNNIQEFINPEIEATGKTLQESEACLSFPGKQRKKSRKKNTVITFSTVENPQERFQLKLSRIFARGLQHEIDHLYGKTLFPVRRK